MWITIAATLLAGHAPLGTAYVAPIQDATVAPLSDARQGRYDLLLRDYNSARDAYRKANSAARKEHTDAGGSRSTFKGQPAIEVDFYPKFQALADSGLAVASIWCISNHSHSGLEGDASTADKLKRYSSILDATPGDKVLFELMRPLSVDARGETPFLSKTAAFALLDEVKNQAKGDALAARALETKAGIANPYGATAEQIAEAVVFYHEIMANYPDSVSAIRCKGPLFAAENLQIGMRAPDIVGQDHDGNDIKLSDFEGKVTVIDFWAFW